MKLLSIVVVSYMLLAISWWMVLLFKKNNEILRLEEKIVALQPSLYSDDNISAIRYEANKQKTMIIGEAIVIGLALLIGMYLIQRSHLTKLKASEQQNNFLLAVTHELKSPLTSIKMAIQTLLKPNIPAPLQSEILNDTVMESKRLENLINNLLLATKIGYSYDYHFQKTELITVIDKAVHPFLNKEDGPKIQINNSSNSQVWIDEGSMVIVITNLIENAIKYAPHSDIEIALEDISSQYVSLKIKDNGVGIPPSERKDVFKKFYRIGSEYTRKTKGTGLGLYIVKEIVEGNKGNISITENIPHGCIFEIKIPIKK